MDRCFLQQFCTVFDFNVGHIGSGGVRRFWRACIAVCKRVQDQKRVTGENRENGAEEVRGGRVALAGDQVLGRIGHGSCAAAFHCLGSWLPRLILYTVYSQECKRNFWSKSAEDTLKRFWQW